MKGKFKLFGHIGLALFLVSVMVLALAPVAQAATAVTEVSVDFPYEDAPNTYSSTSNTYIVHFKPTTALVRGVDYVTVTFPDGTVAMGGDGDTSGNYAFSISSTAPSASTIDFSTNYGNTDLVVGDIWTDCTSTPTVGGNRIKAKSPIDVAAGQDVWVRYVCGSAITAAATEASTYKVYVSTTKDTAPVLSTTFALGDSTCNAGDTSVYTGYPLPSTAGSTATYVIKFSPTTDLTASSTKVTVKFPMQATVPSSLAITDVSFSTDASAYTSAPEVPTVNTYTNEVTAITPLSLTADAGNTFFYMKVEGITNPTVADSSSYLYMVRTSVDNKWECSAADAITASSITKVLVANGEIGTPTSIYSDNATMVDMYSSQIYIALADDSGNAKAPDSAVTVSLTSSSSTGTFYWCDGQTSMSGTVTSCTTVSVDIQDPNASSDGDQIVYYKDSTAGTHTLTFSATGYTSATWTFTVVPGASLYDSDNNLVSTYKPISTSPTAETGDGSPYTQKYSVDYINDAITAAMAGDTVKLGDGTYEVDSGYVSLNKKITLTSVNGAAYTTLRPTSDAIPAVVVGISGTATYPVVIDGLTFDRLRYGVEFDAAVKNGAGYDYLTVQDCTFNYVIPNASGTTEAVVWFLVGGSAVSSATVSNNTFSNCVGFNAISGGRTGVIQFYDTGGSAAVSGVVISGNTLTDCNDYGIAIGSSAAAHTVTISNNTITNGYSAIALCDGMTLATVTGNTITTPYNYGILVEGTNNTTVTIKNNTITGSAGYGIKTDETDDVLTIQYNHISGSGTYGIYSASLTDTSESQNCKYNWWGDASGPTYTALTGATITKSNPDGTGDVITDDVLYYPWLHKPLADVVADNASYQTSTMQLVSGWNTMSTPAKLISTADSIDELIPSGMTIGYYYDGSNFQQITSGYVLSPCDAVYVKMSAATYVQFKIDASAFSTPSKDLVAGWNLVGLSDLTVGGMDADDAMVSVYKSAGNLPGYSQIISPSQNAAQTDIYYTAGGDWTVTMAEHGTDTSNMLPGLGYWCYMQNPATLAGFVITPIVPDLD